MRIEFHFVRAVKSALAPGGIWVFEMSYMPTMLRTNSYDTICHEHLEYYSLAVIEHILDRAEMKLVKASLNDINGGSIRCYATHKNNFKFKRTEFKHGIEAFTAATLTYVVLTTAVIVALRAVERLVAIPGLMARA